MIKDKTLEQLLDDFGRYKMTTRIRQAKSSSIKNYIFNIRHFFKYLGKEIDAVTLQDINNYYLHLKVDLQNSINTQKTKLIPVRLFYDWYSAKYLKPNPTEFMPNIQEEIKIPIMPTPDEFTRMVYACDKTSDIGLRDATILCLLADTGIRRSECAAMNMGSIQLHEKNYVCVVPRIKSREHMVPFAMLTDGALVGEFFSSYYSKRKYVENARPMDPLFIQMGVRFQGERLQEQGINFIVKKYTKLAGINKHLTAHSFRHFFATYSYMHGTDLKTLKDLMGHAWISTTERYVHIAEAIQASSLQHRATTTLKAPDNWQGFVKTVKNINK